jgi:hypothetical protein
MEFLSRPREWVEFAEFNHFDDYWYLNEILINLLS